MKVFVTGSTGFIGRTLCKELVTQGHHVVGYDKREDKRISSDVEQHYGDLHEFDSIQDTIADTAPDALIHLAARTDLNETKDLSGYSSNIDCVRNLSVAIKKITSIKRSIFTSSQLVCRIGYTPVDEKDFCPNTLYGKSKALGEDIVRATLENETWTIVRPTTVWGPEMSDHYRSFINAISKGRYFHCGNSKLYKSYSYIDNIVYQYIQILTVPRSSIIHKVFYLADYNPLSLRDYADRLATRLGANTIPSIPLFAAKALALTGDLINSSGFKSFPFNSFRLRNILTEYIIDMSSTESICGELPVSFEEGVMRTVDWFKSTSNLQIRGTKRK